MQSVMVFSLEENWAAFVRRCEEAEDWLLDNAKNLEWTNQGTEYYDWED